MTAGQGSGSIQVILDHSCPRDGFGDGIFFWGNAEMSRRTVGCLGPVRTSSIARAEAEPCYAMRPDPFLLWERVYQPMIYSPAAVWYSSCVCRFVMILSPSLTPPHSPLSSLTLNNPLTYSRSHTHTHSYTLISHRNLLVMCIVGTPIIINVYINLKN